ncbi:MAG: hypothetical protein KatS3mg019_0777 [Fimbriimonadales bacterium]|nr:MAG: hypothetical protein KatS3mg019_0777 [Fimbriimonadales bacterium]
MKGLRLALSLLGLVLSLTALYAQYEVFLGDRDLQRGALRFDPLANTTSVFGSCNVASGSRFYYGMDFDPRTGYLWACDTLQSRIVALDGNGNCVASIQTPSLPTGLAIHPDGRYAFLTTSSTTVYCYDLSTGQQVSSASLQNVSSLYGLDFSTRGEYLYVCDFSGRQLIQLYADLTTFAISETARVSFSARVFNGQQYTVNPYDVTVRTQYGGRAPIDYIYVTLTTGFYGPYSEVAAGGYAYDTPGFLPEPTTFAVHPNAGPGNFVSFFGIELAPDGLLWVSQYNPGGLFTVDTNTGQVTQRANYGGNKLGVGVAIRAARCVEHEGDVDNNGCVDDADLLAVLFAFGQSGANLGRVDVNCDRVVDDADLLVVLFNFGRGC